MNKIELLWEDSFRQWELYEQDNITRRRELNASHLSDLFPPMPDVVGGFLAKVDSFDGLPEDKLQKLRRWCKRFLVFAEKGNAPIAKYLEQLPAHLELIKTAIPKIQAALTREVGDDGKPKLSDALIATVEERIRRELDPKVKKAPSPSTVFSIFCRDQLTLAKMGRKNRWPYRTLKGRKEELDNFLLRNFRLSLADFLMADRSLFTAAERQLNDHRAKRIDRKQAAEIEEYSDDQES